MSDSIKHNRLISTYPETSYTAMLTDAVMNPEYDFNKLEPETKLFDIDFGDGVSISCSICKPDEKDPTAYMRQIIKIDNSAVSASIFRKPISGLYPNTISINDHDMDYAVLVLPTKHIQKLPISAAQTLLAKACDIKCIYLIKDAYTELYVNPWHIRHKTLCIHTGECTNTIGDKQKREKISAIRDNITGEWISWGKGTPSEVLYAFYKATGKNVSHSEIDNMPFTIHIDTT